MLVGEIGEMVGLNRREDNNGLQTKRGQSPFLAPRLTLALTNGLQWQFNGTEYAFTLDLLSTRAPMWGDFVIHGESTNGWDSSTVIPTLTIPMHCPHWWQIQFIKLMGF